MANKPRNRYSRLPAEYIAHRGYNAVQDMAEGRGHGNRTQGAAIGGLVGAMLGSFAGPVGAGVCAGLGATVGAAIGDEYDR